MSSTMKLSAEMGSTFKTVVNASREIIIDQPKAGGGNDEGANPLEHFLSSIAGCICAIARIKAKQERIELRGVKVNIEADIDKMFLLGKTTEGRAGFTEIRSFIELDADMSQEEKEKFIEEVERRCPVADNISCESVIKTEVK